jgi:hypothetical protein
MGKTKFAKSYEKECLFCKKKYTAFSQRSKYCSDNHRQLFYLRNKQEKIADGYNPKWDVPIEPIKMLDTIHIPNIRTIKLLNLANGYSLNQPRHPEWWEQALVDATKAYRLAVDEFYRILTDDKNKRIYEEYYKEEYLPDLWKEEVELRNWHSKNENPFT